MIRQLGFQTYLASLHFFRSRNAMQSMQTLGVVNEDEDRVQMSAILSLSNLGGKSMGMQSINVVDILALQRHLEIELMKKAM